MACARELACEHVCKKLTPKIARKATRLLALLPLKSLTALLTRGSTAIKILRSSMGILLLRPPGGGSSLLQRLLAESMSVRELEATLGKSLHGLPPVTRQAVLWLIEHRDDGVIPGYSIAIRTRTHS
jgi:hypothetical protein